jgi:hypothetical protein
MGIALAVVGAQAQSVTLVPGDADYSGSIPGNPDAGDVSSIVGVTVDLYYKKDVDTSAEEGPFEFSYDITYSNAPDDPEDALIEYTGGSSISCPECFLLVKDGNQDPIWYIFDIGTWNGTDDIMLDGFWPAQGAISHVSIFGSAAVPVPAAVWLFGSGLLGLVGLARRRSS